jgi:single-stranded-DNA-specific exonuclease
MLFRHDQPLPREIRAVYQLEANEYNGNTTLQLLIESWLPAV